MFNKGYQSHKFAITLFLTVQLEHIHNLNGIDILPTPQLSWIIPFPHAFPRLHHGPTCNCIVAQGANWAVLQGGNQMNRGACSHLA